MTHESPTTRSLKLTAHHPIVVATKIAVIVAPKGARAAVVQIAPPKLDHRVGLAVMAAANVAVAKLVDPVAVGRKQLPNRAALVAKARQKLDEMPVQNVAHKLDRMVPDDVLPMRGQIAHSLRAILKSLNEVPDVAVPISALVRGALNVPTPDAHRHIEVVSAAVR